MSHKITSKNLQYTSNLPPFLARLRGQNAADTDLDGPDPILASRRRPVKQRSGSAEAEDAPLVVDEHGNTVDVSVGADGNVKEKEAQKDGREDPVGTEDKEQGDRPTDADQQTSGEKLAAIGTQRKKRKIGRIIGGGADEEEDAGQDKKSTAPAQRDPDKTAEIRDGAKEQRDSASAAKAKSKKAKKIKLSFGDDES